MWIAVWNLALFSLLTAAYSQLRIVLKMLTATKSGKFQMTIHIDYAMTERKIKLDWFWFLKVMWLGLLCYLEIKVKQALSLLFSRGGFIHSRNSLWKVDSILNVMASPKIFSKECSKSVIGLLSCLKVRKTSQYYK